MSSSCSSFGLGIASQIPISQLDDTEVAAIVGVSQHSATILVYVPQVNGIHFGQVYDSAGVAGVHLLCHVRGHCVEALQEGIVAPEDNESVMIVGVVVADLGVYVI